MLISATITIGYSEVKRVGKSIVLWMEILLG